MNANLYKMVVGSFHDLVCPADIACEFKISTSDTIDYLFIGIGRGVLHKSDLFLALDEKYAPCRNRLDSFMNLSQKRMRAKLLTFFKSYDKDTRANLLNLPFDSDVEELEIYVSLLKRPVFVDDIYLLLTDLERTLHLKVKSILVQEFGEKESEWWKRGVPGAVRINCAQAKEFDDESIEHPYHFTTFIHLKKIMEANWSLLSTKLPQSVVGKTAKAAFLKNMDRLNRIRNQVMHPVRNESPAREDFKFVREMHDELVRQNWLFDV